LRIPFFVKMARTLLLILPALFASAGAACTKSVSVKSGDTCWALWTNNGLSEAQFSQLNPGVNCGNLQIGQSLCVGGSASAPPPPPPPPPPSSGGGGSTTGNYVRGCYFTNWAQYRSGRAKFTPANYVPGLCTHIFYSFAGVNGDFTSKATDPTDTGSNGQFAQINALKKQDSGLKTLLSYGGANFAASTFKSISSSSANRQKFIQSAIQFAKQNGFDGIDIDWEFPDASDKANFANLLKDLKAAAGGLLITAAVSQNPSVIKSSYDGGAIAPHVDWLNVMAYDYHGTWEQQTGANAPLFDNSDLSIDGAMKTWVQVGMPKNKLAIGMATYGRGWTANGGMGAQASGPSQATQFIQEAGIIAYFEICEKLASGKRTFDSKTQTPYLQSGNQWYTYDDVQSITAKADYIKQNGYRGAFFWTLDEDDFNAKCPNSNGVRYPLIGTVAKVLGGKTIKKRSLAGRLF
jgi:chitinase